MASSRRCARRGPQAKLLELVHRLDRETSGLLLRRQEARGAGRAARACCASGEVDKHLPGARSRALATSGAREIRGTLHKYVDGRGRAARGGATSGRAVAAVTVVRPLAATARAQPARVRAPHRTHAPDPRAPGARRASRSWATTSTAISRSTARCARRGAEAPVPACAPRSRSCIRSAGPALQLEVPLPAGAGVGHRRSLRRGRPCLSALPPDRLRLGRHADRLGVDHRRVHPGGEPRPGPAGADARTCQPRDRSRTAGRVAHRGARAAGGPRDGLRRALPRAFPGAGGCDAAVRGNRGAARGAARARLSAGDRHRQEPPRTRARARRLRPARATSLPRAARTRRDRSPTRRCCKSS